MSTLDLVFTIICGVVGRTALAFFLGRRFERKAVADYLAVVQKNTANSKYHSKETSD